MWSTEEPDQKAFLFGIDTGKGLWSAEDSLEELAQLAQTAGLAPVGRSSQKREAPHPASYMGPGKLDEVAVEIQSCGAGMLVVDDEIPPAQQRALEKKLEIPVVDRTALILEIFAKHARTREGQLQVELAQYEYLLPRLAGMWTHLERQAGGRRGGVGLRGPGETQLEMDRRVARKRMAALRDELDTVRGQRLQHRERRRRNEAPVVALTGYTNAGKSSLLNRIAGTDVLAADQLFATLDPTMRRVRLPRGGTALFSDTVGFINKLPHQLVSAFRATLEEIGEADVILLVVDAAHPRAEEQRAVSRAVLDDLGASRDRTLTVWNKIDLLHAGVTGPDGALRVSARTGSGVPQLLQAVEEGLRAGMEQLALLLPYSESQLARDVRTQGIVLTEDADEAGMRLHAYVPPRLAGRLRAAGAVTGA
jgi:GTPase